MTEPEVTEFYAESPDGARRRVSLRVGPVAPSGSEQRCILVMDGLDNPEECLRASLFQALSMAVRGVRETLIQRTIDGWRSYAAKNDAEQFDPLFAWSNEESEPCQPRSWWR